MRVAIAGWILLVLGGCEGSSLVFRGSAPCPPGEGTVETWCDDPGNCEFRVSSTGSVYACTAGDTTGCNAAGISAAEECRLGMRPDAGTDAAIPCEPTTELDLLFVIDDSNSTLSELVLLRNEIPLLLRTLSERASLHVGVITTDLGAGPVPPTTVVPSCDPGFGDDGILVSTSRGLSGCLPTYPSRIFELGMGEASEDLSTAIGCVADVGTSGCGFEQSLEAPLKALSPAAPADFVSSTYVAPTFAEGGMGHGDGENAGFLRADSVLAILTLTDEDDCSVPEYDLLYPGTPEYADIPLNLRCIRRLDALHPVQRYVDGFLQLRRSPGRLVYVAIAGVPRALEGRDYDAMLAAPEMAYRDDTSMDPPLRILPSCEEGTGIALPPRRIVEVASGLDRAGAHTAVLSVCSDNGSPWRTSLVDETLAALSCGP